MQVKNEITKVSFNATNCGNWFIKLNGTAITEMNFSIRSLVSFGSLKRAVKYAIRKGYIPKSFKVEDIMNDVAVSVNS